MKNTGYVNHATPSTGSLEITECGVGQADAPGRHRALPALCGIVSHEFESLEKALAEHFDAIAPVCGPGTDADGSKGLPLPHAASTVGGELSNYANRLQRLAASVRSMTARVEA